MIAQEVEEVFPEWVKTDSEGYETLSIGGFEALAVEAMRELNDKIASIQEENKQLKNQLDQQQKEIEALKTKINNL